ncbi:hypothetical protein EVAR_10173_1 [Eumeta japonica]|uniref:Uncharacterized protein n=1 Tax=Eumeta variegata TaxID=151549 RepID=A0A4C1TEC5_EUMVA|nr:hypothetical protein EVAR_10173_1 [Eumeta japonica]
MNTIDGITKKVYRQCICDWLLFIKASSSEWQTSLVHGSAVELQKSAGVLTRTRSKVLQLASRRSREAHCGILHGDGYSEIIINLSIEISDYPSHLASKGGAGAGGEGS